MSESMLEPKELMTVRLDDISRDDFYCWVDLTNDRMISAIHPLNLTFHRLMLLTAMFFSIQPLFL
jgi:hypothetical protein